MEERKWTHLTAEERGTLNSMRAQRKSFGEIAKELKRARSTIYRELKRNAPPWHLARTMSVYERTRYAVEKAAQRKREQGCRYGRYKLAQRLDVTSRLETLLEHTRYSPEEIAEILSQSDLGMELSGKTIRRWVKRCRPNYKQYFPLRGKRPRCGLTPKRQPSPSGEKRSIHERDFDPQSTLGHLQCDMLVCSQSRAAILSIKDTRSGKAFLRPVSSLEAAKVRVAISNVLYNIPPYIPKSMLFDRGSEFANAHQLELLHRITTYFCDAYKAWQKGAVEEQNKEIRRYIPKGTDLSTITEEKLGRIESLLNTKPRRRLGGLAADDLWFFELRAAKRALH